ncbi:MAG: GNAT family N-acetyltransferase [Anaerolineae bacterium]|nr:GNAT family N-acetyltransferase [Anaerolineae bacterium]
MAYYKKIVGEKCYLSPCSLGDAEKWVEWFNDLEVTLPLGDEAYTPFSLPKTEESIEYIIKQQDHVFSIVDLESDICIGRTLLFNIDHINRQAMFGIFIGEKLFWGKGYGQEATRLTIDYGFNLLNLNSIMLGVMAFNERAVHAYEKVGFKLIGRRRQARIVGGQKFDVFLMDILAEEFDGTLLKKYARG